MPRTSPTVSFALQVGGFRPTRDPLASHFGFTPVGRADEPWPALENGQPLLFICQLNLSLAPVRPQILEDIALLTFFVDPEPGANLAEENNRNWCLRTYPDLASLTPLTRPAGAPALKRSAECVWESVKDRTAARTKIGGRPAEIQSKPWWDYRKHPAAPQFCVQINSEAKVCLAWGDAGTMYLARGTAAGCRDQWFLDWQCY